MADYYQDKPVNINDYVIIKHPDGRTETAAEYNRRVCQSTGDSGSGYYPQSSRPDNYIPTAPPGIRMADDASKGALHAALANQQTSLADSTATNHILASEVQSSRQTIAQLNAKNAHLKEAPILERELTRVPAKGNDLSALCRELSVLSRPVDRLSVILFLIAGLCYTLLRRHVGAPNFYLNLVATDDFPTHVISSWLQIFNRAQLKCTAASKSTDQFINEVSRACDEVVLLDSRSYNGENQYSRGKREKNINLLINTVTTGSTLPNGKELNAAVAIISNSFRCGNAINVPLPEVQKLDLERHKRFVQQNVLEGFITSALDVFTDNKKLFCQIERHENSSTYQFAVVRALLRLTEELFAAYHYDMFQALQLPSKILLNWFFEDADFDETDTVDAFVDTIRHGINRFRSEKKTRNTVLEENTFYEHGAWYYFPRQMLTELFRQERNSTLPSKALPLLRTNGVMQTDGENLLTKKLSFANQRIKCYVIQRDLLNPLGYVDLTIIANSKQEGSNHDQGSGAS